MTRFLRPALLCLLMATAGLSSAQAQQRPLTEWEQRARALLKELVEFNTTQSAGDMTAAAEAMARHMRAAGFPAEDIVVVEAGKAKQGNLIVRYRGR